MLAHHRVFFRCVSLLTIISFLPSSVQAWYFLPQAQAVVMAADDGPLPLPTKKLEHLAANTDGAVAPLPLSEEKKKQLAAGNVAPTQVAQAEGVVGNLTLGITPDANTSTLKTLSREELQRATAGPRVVENNPYDAGLPDASTLIAALDGALEQKKSGANKANIKVAQAGGQPDLTAGAEAAARLLAAASKRESGAYTEATMDYVQVMNDYPNDPQAVKAADRGIVRMVKDIKAGLRTEEEIAALEQQLASYEPTTVQGGYGVLTYLGRRAEDEYDKRSERHLVEEYSRKAVARAKMVMQLDPHHPKQMGVIDEYLVCAQRLPLTEQDVAIQDLKAITEAMPPSVGRLSAWFSLANFEGESRKNRGLAAVYRANLLADASGAYMAPIFADPAVEPWLKGMIGHAIGGAHWSLGNYDDAIAFYEATLPHMSDAGSTRALVELSLAQAKADKYRNDPVLAAEQYSNYLNRFPNTKHAPKALAHLASVFMTAGDYQGAADLYSEIVLRWPESRHAMEAQAALDYIFENLYESTPVAGLLPPTEAEQALAMRCGPEALSRLVAGEGLHLDVDELAELAGTDATGTSMAGLIDAAKAKGISLSGVQVEGIDALQAPYIAYVNGDHFVLVTAADDDGVTVVDDGEGERVLSRGAFAAMWNGMALVTGDYEDSGMTVAALNQARGGNQNGNSGDEDPPCDDPCCDDDGGGSNSVGGSPCDDDGGPPGSANSPTSNIGVSSPGLTNPMVNTFETALKLHEKDLTLAVRGALNLTFARTYINEKGWHRGEYQGTTKPWKNNIGDGWTHNLNTHIVASSGTTPSFVTLYDSQGSARIYEYDSTSGGYDWYYRHAKGQTGEKGNVLKRNTTTKEFTLEKSSGLIQEFSAATTDSYRFARLEAIKDDSDNTITLAYDGVNGSGKLTKATSPTSDYSLNLGYSGALITKVELKKSATVINSAQYAYASNELTKVTDHASKTVLYEYDTLIVEGKYDDEYFGRFITKITDKSSTDLDLAWSWYTGGTGQATKITVTNAAGLVTKYDRTLSNVVTITNWDGATQLNKFVNTPVSSSDVGRSKYHDYYKDATTYERWEYQYDASNNLTKLLAPDASVLTTLSHNAQGQMASLKIGTGPTKYWEYDSSGLRLTKYTDAVGIDTNYYYNASGLRTKLTHPSLASAGYTYAYNSNGQLTRRTNPAGVHTDYEFDSLGRYTKTIKDSGGLNISTTLYYDDLGKATRVKNPLGQDTYYYYGDINCGSCGGGGQLTKIKDALNNEKKWEYDSDGLLTKSIGKSGVGTSYEYDNMRRKTKAIFPSGGSVYSTVAYDLMGRVTSRTNMSGHTTTFTYDHMGRKTGVTDPVGDIDYNYNNLGLLSTITDSLNHTTTNEYDGTFRLTKVTDAIGKTTLYAYDNYGHRTKVGAGPSGTIDPTTHLFDNVTGMLTKVQYSSSSYEANYHYDGEARVTKITDWLDGTNGLRYAYDNVGRITQLTDYDNSTLTYTYDDRGNVLTMNDYHGNSTAYTYNDIGRISTITAPGNKIWTYSYDGQSRLTKVDIPNGMHTEYAYDSQGRHTKIQHKDGSTVNQSFEYAFNDGLQITTITHDDGSYWSYEYDGRDRLTKAERYDNTPSLLHRFTYTYDDGDNLLTKAVYDAATTTTDSTTFGYNNANEQTSRLNGGTAVTQAYDAWGRLTSKSDGTHSATYAYRYGSKLYSITSDFPDEGNVTYETGADQKRRSRVAGVSETWYNYTTGFDVVSTEDDADGSTGALTITNVIRRPTVRTSEALGDLAGATPASGTARYYGKDRIRSTRSIWDAAKASIGSFEFTPYGREYAHTGATILASLAGAFTGKSWDDNAQLYHFPYRQYSPTMTIWTSRDPLGMVDGPNMYTYVRGNPIVRVDPDGRCWDDDDDYDGGFDDDDDDNDWMDDIFPPFHHPDGNPTQEGNDNFVPPFEFDPKPNDDSDGEYDWMDDNGDWIDDVMDGIGDIVELLGATLNIGVGRLFPPVPIICPLPGQGVPPPGGWRA